MSEHDDATTPHTPEQPPTAPRRAFERTHHGQTTSDPYAWMRDREDPELIAYLEAENSYADARTAHLEPLREKLFQEIKSRVQETDLSVPIGDGPWWYYGRTIEGQQYAVHARCPRPGPSAPRPALEPGEIPDGEQVLLDGNAAAAGHEFFSLGVLSVSPDHARLAAGIDLEGDERFDITITEIATGEILDQAITGAGYGGEFDNSGRYFFYVVVDDAWRPYQVWRHEVGTPREQDVKVYQEDDERFWLGLGGSRDDSHLVIDLATKTTTESWILPADQPLGDWRLVRERVDGVEYGIEIAGETILIVHNIRNREGDLAWTDLADPGEWLPVATSGPGERFLGVDAFDDFAVLTLRAEGLPTLRVLPRDAATESGFGEPLPWPGAGELTAVHLAENPEPATTELVITEESFIHPRATYAVQPLNGGRTLLKRQPVLGDFDPADYEESREWVQTVDGTRIPVSIVRRAGLEPVGLAPGLLVGYGAYEISSDPYFSVARLSLLDRGVVYAVAHVRGGGELGRGWYEDGKLAAKTNTFTDFVAVADDLRGRWVHIDRLACEGGSAGGLLIGAALNLSPQSFRAAHAAVPFVDALTSMLDPDLPLTAGEWEEWGNPLADPAAYDTMAAYAPYDNVRATAYPAILATTSLHDTRVLVTEPAKWIARLREVATNDPVTRPILLHTEMSAGHGGRSGRYDAWREVAWEWAWLLDQLGAVETVH